MHDEFEDIVDFEITSPASRIRVKTQEGDETKIYVATHGDTVELTRERAQQLAKDGVGRIVDEDEDDGGYTGPVAVTDPEEDPATTEKVLEPAPDDLLVSITKDMVESGKDLTGAGMPEVAALREAVVESGFDGDAVNAEVRDAAFAAFEAAQSTEE